MKKILTIFLCFLAGVLVYSLWPEYGSGYSEAQRRLWNERRALYPISWVVNGSEPGRGGTNPYSDIAQMTGMTKRKTELVMKEKKEIEAELVRELEANRDRSGPDYKVKEALPANVSQLPLYGLTEQEIAGRALAGDGDACLKMVQFLCQNSNRLGVIQLNWRERHEADKWLDRAVAVKRPGAVFLKTLFKEARDFQKSLGVNRRLTPGEQFISLSTGKLVAMTGGKFDIDKLAGYSDFVDCLEKGDYFVYRTASGMLPAVDILREKELMHSVLLKGAESGSVDSQRDLALLFFEEGTFRERDLPYFSMNTYINLKSWDWENKLKWLPDSWEKEIVSSLFTAGVIDAKKSPIMKKFREASLYARKAAQQGDMTGMYLWVRHGITSMEKYSAREWNDIFSYCRLLYESGYAPYLERVGQNSKIRYMEEALDNVILRSYYSPKSYEPLLKKNHFVSRNPVWTFSSKDTLEEIRKKVQAVCQIGMTDRFLENQVVGWGGAAGELMSGATEEVKKYLLDQVEEWVAEGDLTAIYTLAVIYEKGMGTEADMGRAYSLYRRALEQADDYPDFTVALNDCNGNPYMCQGISVKHVARLKMAEMVLNHRDFPGRNEKEAYDLVLDSLRAGSAEGYCYPILGLFHEKGIGRSVDRERALEFYTKGKSVSQACREALGRLTVEKKEANK